MWAQRCRCETGPQPKAPCSDLTGSALAHQNFQPDLVAVVHGSDAPTGLSIQEPRAASALLAEVVDLRSTEDALAWYVPAGVPGVPGVPGADLRGTTPSV